MKNYKNIKGINALTDCKNNLKNGINLNLELLEKDKNLKVKFFKETTIIKSLQGEIRVLDAKIKAICIKANLNLQDGGFMEDQRNQFIFWSSI